MKELLQAMLAACQTGGGAVLATIVARRGSAPRGVGTAMVISQDGAQTGTVGGGTLEFQVRQDALRLLELHENAIHSYEIHADGHAVYSGGVRVLFRPFTGSAAISRIKEMLNAIERGDRAYLICNLVNDSSYPAELADEATLLEKTGLRELPERAVLTDGETGWLIEPLADATRVVLFGGGHVAQVMARQLDLLDLRIWVVEDRPAFAQEALFPMAERVIMSDYGEAQPLVRLTARDHVIVMSSGHETDYQILRRVLRSEADYIGCIGSSRKIALTKERLREDGLTESQIGRLHAPIGLSICAETPAEIAVSVAAELIQHCARNREKE